MDTDALPGAVKGLPKQMGVRELGGIRGANGRPIRHGLMYRGSPLIDLAFEQREVIDGLGLRLILDLRAMGETDRREDYVPAGCGYVRRCGMLDKDGHEVDFSPLGIGRIMESIRRDPEGFMSDLYASMVFGNRAVHELVDRLRDEQVPLYFHCTAGKDRTGVCAAIVLLLLGVSRDDIMQEFLLTNEYRSDIINMTPDQMPEGMSDLDRENWAAINSVHEAHLQRVFDEIDGRYATVEEYFAGEFGIEANELASLRDRYLVTPDLPMVPIPDATQMVDTPFVKVYDLVYADGTHYYDASRHDREHLLALKKERELTSTIPDAVSCCLVLAPEGEEPMLVLFYEYRYPTGQYVLGIPSGLVDEQDRLRRNPLVAATVREIYEETGLAFGKRDSISVINPMLFNSPGMTDESTALMCAIIRDGNASMLSQAGACGTERFGKFELLTKDDAWRVLQKGRDRFGSPYPMVTWAALAYFATDQWKS